MKIQLPAFNITVVLGTKPMSQPTNDDLEALRRVTANYLCLKLKPKCPKIVGLDIKFNVSSMRSVVNKLEPQHTVCFDVDAAAYFPSCSKSDYTEIFNSVSQALESGDYIKRAVCALDSSNPFASAVDVKVGLGELSTEEGGIVQSPTFYLGFVCRNEPGFCPSESEKQNLWFLTQEETTGCLQQAFPNNFEGVTLKMRKAEIGERARELDSRFSLYVEFDAAASFKKELPTSKQLFYALATCISSRFIKNFMDIGGLFSDVSTMSINYCITQKGGILMPTESEMGPYKRAAEPEDPTEIEEDDTSSGEPHARACIGFALGIPKCQRVPTEADYQALAAITKEFYVKCLKQKFGDDTFQDIDISLGETHFGSGKPTEEYNVYIQWDISTQFMGTAKSFPDQYKICKALVKAKPDRFYSRIRALYQTPFSGATCFFVEPVVCTDL